MKVKLDLIDEKGLKKKWVADQIGVTVKSLSKWEKGESEPGFYKMVKLAKLLDVSLEELYEEE